MSVDRITQFDQAPPPTFMASDMSIRNSSQENHSADSKANQSPTHSTNLDVVLPSASRHERFSDAFHSTNQAHCPATDAKSSNAQAECPLPGFALPAFMQKWVDEPPLAYTDEKCQRLEKWLETLPPGSHELKRLLDAADDGSWVLPQLIRLRGSEIFLTAPTIVEKLNVLRKIVRGKGVDTFIDIIEHHTQELGVEKMVSVAGESGSKGTHFLLLVLSKMTNAEPLSKVLKRHGSHHIRCIMDFEQVKTLRPFLTLTHQAERTIKYIKLKDLHLATAESCKIGSPIRVRIDNSALAAWVHVPATDGVVAMAVLQSFIWEAKVTDPYLDPIHVPDISPPSIYPSDKSLIYREPGVWYMFRQEFDDPFQECYSVVFPYFYLDGTNSYASRKEAHRSLLERLPEYRDRIQFERTLHEAYYPGVSIKVLESMNASQVVSRETNASKTGPNPDDGIQIFLVPQLWLWNWNGYVLSACALPQQDRFGRNGLLTGAVRADPLQDINQGTLLMCLIIADKIMDFVKPHNTDRTPALDIYQRAVFSLLTDVNNYIDLPPAHKPDIKQEREFLRRISQMQGEFAIILEILLQQAQVVDDLLVHCPFYDQEKRALEKIKGSDSQSKLHQYLWEQVVEARRELNRTRERTLRMVRDAERISSSIKDELELKRTHASMNDARSNLVLGTAVAGFTIITIIFVPLSFLASLLALPSEQFIMRGQYAFVPVGAKEEARAYKSGYLRKWFAVGEILSLMVTAVVVIVSLRLAGVITIRGMLRWLLTTPGSLKDSIVDWWETPRQKKPSKPLPPPPSEKSTAPDPSSSLDAATDTALTRPADGNSPHTVASSSVPRAQNVQTDCSDPTNHSWSSIPPQHPPLIPKEESKKSDLSAEARPKDNGKKKSGSSNHQTRSLLGMLRLRNPKNLENRLPEDPAQSV